jgi:hypothetical protein
MPDGGDINIGRMNTAVINPYVLAEVVAGRRVPWGQVPDALHEQLELVPERSPLLDVEVRLPADDLEASPGTVGNIPTLADLGSRFHTTDVAGSSLNGTVAVRDVGWWRPIELTKVDGTFAIEASAFKK